MTTMDSDSESQDSDDGRRFRFEATRKDATLVSHSRKRVSPHSGRSRRRSRSRGRSDRDRKDNERFSNRDRNSRSGHNSRQASRDRDLKDRRDRHSSQNYVKDTKDAHDSKHLQQRNGLSTQRERDDRETRDSKDLKDTRDSKDIRDSKESHSKSCRSYEKDSRNSKESRSSRDRNRKRSRDRSLSDRSSSDKHKVKIHEKHKSHSKDNHTRIKEEQVPENIEDAKASLIDQTENELKKEVAVTAQDKCTEFNISDFEIVSDTENSSDAFGDIPSDSSKVKKRLSKQQSQRLTERDSERKSHRREDLRKVNPRNGNHSSASSNSNPSALSDFSLGSASPTTSANKKLKGEEEEACRMEVDVETSQDSSVSEERTKSNESDKPFSYGPVLPPQLVRGSSSDPRPLDDKEEGEIAVKMEIVQNESVENVEKIEREDLNKEKVIGPSLTPTSSKSSDLDRLEDVLSPIANEANLDREDTVVKSETEKKSSSGVLREESLQKSSQPRIIGPSLPAHFLPQTEESDEDNFGPALPPHLVKKEKLGSRVLGPTLPSELKSDIKSAEELESDDEDIIGPLPPDHPAAKSSIVQQSLEFRARRIQSEFIAQQVPKEKKREEWMTELPAIRSSALGLGPRKFKARPGPDLSDRSSWTDTPADRARKEQERAEERLAALVTEKAMVKEISISKEGVFEKSKKRQKSLMEMHQKKLKKKKKKEEKEAKEKGKQPTRRPFDRDVDLQANRFDDVQKKHVFMKAQLLDDRFARGSI